MRVMNILASTRQQKGSALITVLVFLTIMTILGISTMSTTRLGVKMASNSQFRVQAFQAAESGLSDLMREVENNPTVISTSNSSSFDYYYNADAHGTFSDPNDATTPAPKYTEKVAVAVNFEVSKVLNAQGFGQNFAANHYNAIATGQSSAGGESQTVQGFFVIGPNSQR